MIHSSVKKAYEAVALFALLNMVALAALIVYLATSGAINAEKVRLLADVVRGRALAPAETKDKKQPDSEAVAAVAKVEADAVPSEVEREIMRREADRLKEELRQRLALNNSIMLRATTEREAFQREREAELRSRRAREEARQSEGFEKQVAILQAMQPKIAVEHLLGNDDLDEAARILAEMNTRNAKKIVEAAKSERQRRQMMTILQRIREVTPQNPLTQGEAAALNETLAEKQP